LKRTGLEYFDIFYSHRYDPDTPIEETMQALVDIVRAGKALYVGISNYPADKQQECYNYLRNAHVPCVISQYKASLLMPDTLTNNLPVANNNGSGFICYSPLAQGLLTNRYLNGIPADSRMARNFFLKRDVLTDEMLQRISDLDEVATDRGQTLSAMALSWLLQNSAVTSAIIGASSSKQLKANLKAVENISFTESELQRINAIANTL
jgi:L-glyceraldehyde 3-phosphate reductase